MKSAIAAFNPSDCAFALAHSASYIALVQKRWDAESGEALPDQERQYSLSELEREKERYDAEIARVKAQSDGLATAIEDYKKL